MKTVGFKKKKKRSIILAVLGLLGELIGGTHTLLVSMANVKHYNFCLIYATKNKIQKGMKGK